MTTAPARISLLHRYANPAAFGRLSSKVLPWSAGIAILLLGLGTYFALFDSPPDYQQGNSVRIMYVHVPAAIMSEVVYGMMAAAAAAGFIWKHALADLFVKAAAPLGAAFTFVCLVAGSLWGKPMWGTWWVWDARLTSELVLFFLYLGYLALVDAFDDPQRGLKAGAILVLVGVVDLPIIKFSVDWWNTLHQPASLMTLSGPKVDPSMLLPLMLMIGGFTAFFVAVVMLRLESELLARRIRAWRTAAGDE
jgi:heme exporter protein C